MLKMIGTENHVDDASVLQALQEISCAQKHIRRSLTESAYYLVKHYLILPFEVSRRLTKLSPEVIDRVQTLSGKTESDEIVRELANEEAFQQVIRAINTYRARLGYAPLDPDGWPVRTDRPDEESEVEIGG
jgi:hypothetical protein